MTTPFLPFPSFRALDSAGVPLAGGKLYTYVATTQTNKVTWSDAAGTAANSNPVILDTTGSATVRLDPGFYDLVLTDQFGNVQDTWESYESNYFTQADIGAALYPRTAAEITSSVSPSMFYLEESDTRRYGALASAANNSTAINDALSVASNGGASAYSYAGTWLYTSALTAPLSASLSGEGQLTVLGPNGCDGLHFGIEGTYAGSRFFRDFQLNQQASGFVNNGLLVDFTAASLDKVTGDVFSNLSINGFAQAVSVRGLWSSVFRDCFLYNNYQGYLFDGQSVQILIESGLIQKGSATGSGTSYGVLAQADSGEQAQQVVLLGTNIYSFDIGLAFGPVFYGIVADSSINFSKQYAIQIVGVNGGTTIENNFLQTDNGSFATAAVLMSDLGSTVWDKIKISNNECECNTANAGSIGLYIGTNYFGVTASDNTVGTQGLPWATGIKTGVAHNVQIKGNSIAATVTALLLHSSSANAVIGPNTIQPGALQAATMTNSSANIGVTDSTQYAVGSYVQFDATENGFTVGVDYCVLTSTGNVLTLGPLGGTAIAATGSTAVNVFAQLAPLQFTSLTPIGLKFSGSGIFAAQLSGLTTTVRVLVSWQADGGNFTLWIPTASGTSNATSMTLLGLPSYLWPVTNQTQLCVVEDSGTVQMGLATIAAATGLITFASSVASAAFTNSGTKAIAGNNSMTFPYA